MRSMCAEMLMLTLLSLVTFLDITAVLSCFKMLKIL